MFLISGQHLGCQQKKQSASVPIFVIFHQRLCHNYYKTGQLGRNHQMGQNRNPGAQSLRVFLFTSVLIFICISFFFFLFELCQKLKVSFTFSFLFAFSFFVCVWAFWATVQYRLYYVTLSNVNFILCLLG